MQTKRKLILTITLWILYFVCQSVFYPVLTNHQALQQFNDNTEAFTAYAFYQQIWSHSWLILIIISLLLFSKELKSLFKNQ